jgi:hypothetical protein
MVNVEDLVVYEKQLSLESCSDIARIMDQYKHNDMFEIIKVSNRLISVDKDESEFSKYLKQITSFIEQQYSAKTGKTIYLKHFWLSEHMEGPGGPIHIDMEHSPDNADFELSAIAYFNDDFTGGELNFPKLKYDFMPSTGDIVTFPPSGIKYMHRVKPITSGKRQSVAMWFTCIKDNRLEFLYGSDK